MKKNYKMPIIELVELESMIYHRFFFCLIMN